MVAVAVVSGYPYVWSEDDDFPLQAICEDDNEDYYFKGYWYFKGRGMYHLDFAILSFIDSTCGRNDKRYCKYDPQPCLKHFERVENMRIDPHDTVRAFVCREVNSTKYHYVFWNKNDTIVYQEPSTYVLFDKEYPTASIIDSYPFKLLNADKFECEYIPAEYVMFPNSTICYGFTFYFSSGKIKDVQWDKCYDLTIPREIKAKLLNK